MPYIQQSLLIGNYLHIKCLLDKALFLFYICNPKEIKNLLETNV